MPTRIRVQARYHVQAVGKSGAQPRAHAVDRCSVGWLHQFVTKVGASAIAVDSVQTAGLEADDMRHLLSTTPLRLAIGISQLNRAGQPHAARSWEYECDVCLLVEADMWGVAKSRYQQLPMTGAVNPKEVADVA